ncbi:MAG TPA: pyruvate kinase [Alloacidobacterium sp.]|nr:pyruvate kinase [Alloacidobacterium sp.]
MKSAETRLLQDLAAQLRGLCADMQTLESSLVDRSLPLDKHHLRSVRNLAHYLALRRHDIRALQMELAALGLSSLGRTESHVLSAIQTVLHILNALIGSGDQSCFVIEPPVKLDEGSELLKKNTDALLGRKPAGRRVRIMVTMPTEASTDYALVRDLVRSGMDCMRINCAHDHPDVWLGMIRNLREATKETGRSCRVEMDLAGPKLRTGPIEPGGAVVRCRPERDELGRVTKAAHIWLTPIESGEAPPEPAAATLQLPQAFLAALQRNDTVRFRDARNSHRSMCIVKVEGQSRWAEIRQTAYFVPEIELHAVNGDKAHDVKAGSLSGRVGPIPARAQSLRLKPGESLILTRSIQPGRPAVRDKDGKVTTAARIGVTLPSFFEHAKAGERIWFDDGKIGGVIRSVNSKTVRVEITQARPQGENLGEGKGINLPDTRIEMPALTAEDIEHLKFVIEHADLVGYSFVRTEDDVRQLLARLHELKGDSLGIVLKIETREAFENLPALILAAMALRAVGVMIARGDLAVECGYQRLAEVQEEILWISEAAHVPVIWATQVLESLSKNGIPSRSEITDAAMGERAECVMLNKGPYVVLAVKTLDDILKRMQAHQQKKSSMLRRLRIASSFAGAV